MGCLLCTCCFDTKVQLNILMAGREDSGKSHTLYQMMGDVSALATKPTPVFNNEVVRFRKYGRKFEIWDPSGQEDNIQFWESLYKNIAFNVIVYVVDARGYWNKDKRVHNVMKDRMELHSLLCAPELASAHVILYLNWKTELELGEEKNMQEAIPDELELFKFPKRAIKIVDTFQELVGALMNIPLPEED